VAKTLLNAALEIEFAFYHLEVVALGRRLMELLHLLRVWSH